MKGKVKWFSNSRCYGFITAEDGSDIFVHFSNINMKGYKTLLDNDEVTFEIEEIPKKGKQAVKVTKVSKEE